MNKSQIAKALREAAFTPSKLGPMKIIADVGNINYYVRRATEFLILSFTALTQDQRVKYYDSAMGLIALAKVKTQEQGISNQNNTPNCGPALGSVKETPKITQTKEETKERAIKIPDTVDCTQSVCDSGKCIAKGLCPGMDVLDAAKEIYGKR